MYPLENRHRESTRNVHQSAGNNSAQRSLLVENGQSSLLKPINSKFRRREVSSLTPHQLARKRTRDRESQRATRQRSKEYIENLEEEINELRRCAASKEAGFLFQFKEFEETIARLRVGIDVSVVTPNLDLDMSLAISKPGLINLYDNYIVPDIVVSSTLASHPLVHEPSLPGGDIVDENGSYQQAVYPCPPDPYGTPTQILPNTLHLAPTSIVNQPATKFWEIPVMLLPPENTISGTLLSILHGERILNMSKPTIHPLPNPSFRTLILPESKPDDLVSVAIINLTFSAGMTRIPEIMAAVWGCYKLLSWQIRPCLETYQNLPAWLSPRPSQLVSPHPHWVTQLQFPKLRDRVIERPDLYANQSFLALYPQSLRVNWPFDDSDTYKFENGTVKITDVFEKHISDVSNWSLTAPFTHAFPELQSACRYTS